MMRVPGRAHEKSTNQNQTVLGYREDRAEALSSPSVNPKMQRVPGAVLGTVFGSVSFRADPAFAEESESLHTLI
jgi:hypothetical protein